MKKIAWLFGLSVIFALPACALAEISPNFFPSLPNYQPRRLVTGHFIKPAPAPPRKSHLDLDYLNAVRYVMRSA